MYKSVLVTGGTGQLGRSLQRLQPIAAGLEFRFVGSSDLDFCDSAALEAFFQSNRFDFIVNCAAFTAVDAAETESRVAEQVNHHAVAILANAAAASGATLIHVSTDYVFDGRHFRPYTEDHRTSPVNAYGRSKLSGEAAVKASGACGYVLRTSWLYSEYGRNFVTTMLRLGAERDELRVVNDQLGTPTYAGDLASVIIMLMERALAEPTSDLQVLHYSNEGACSWYDFAVAVMELAGRGCQVKPIPSEGYPMPAARPFFSVLSKDRIRRYLSLDVPHWRMSLQRCIHNIERQVDG